MRKTSLNAECSRGVGTPSPDALRTMLRIAGSAPTSPRKRGEVNTTSLLLHLSPRAGRGRIALAIRVRGRLRKGDRDGFENARHVAEHIVIPEPQYPVIVSDKPLVANRIVQIVDVLPAVHLNDKATFTADQIDRVWAERFLPNELVAIEPARAKAKPERGYRIRSGFSQAPGASGPDLISLSHVETPPHPDRRKAMIRPLPARGARLASRMTQ
jgi:hypothetical protein